MTAAHTGRLELTWTDKDKALLAHEDQTYEWVDPYDYRVSEVRLLHDVTAVGDVGAETKRANDNLLIRGDALHALNSLLSIPEFNRVYAGHVKLCYIDPPFNTGQAFVEYDDALEHSVWLTMMRDRLVQIRDLLAPDGSVWVHLDDTEAAYCRAVMDEVFGRANFVGTVVWQKIHGRNNSAQHLSAVHDYLLVYARSKPSLVFNRTNRTELSDKEFWNPDHDPRGLWRRSDLTASHSYEGGRYQVVGPNGDVFAPRDNRWWSCSEETFEALRADNRLWWGKTGSTFPFRKRFQSELGGLVPSTFWTHDEVGDNREAKQEVTRLFDRSRIFATPKPERLMQRIIEIGSSVGDIVLDCFGGSGTTPAVAHKMRRRWIGVERDPETVASYLLPRLEQVVEGNDLGGITESAKWPGGGGFRVLDIGPSMFEDVEGRIYLADWAIGGALGEAVAAQLGYDFRKGASGPFSGAKGKTRLAVVDGLVNEAVIKLLVDALPEGQKMLVCGTAIDEECRPLLRTLRKGSTMKKIPTALLDDYRSRRRDRLALASMLDWSQASRMLDEVGVVRTANGARA